MFFGFRLQDSKNGFAADESSRFWQFCR